MITILSSPPDSIVDRLAVELSGIVPGKAIVYQSDIHDYVIYALSRIGLAPCRVEPTGNHGELVLVAMQRQPKQSANQTVDDGKILSLLPCRRRDLLRRLHLTASQIDDAVSRLGLVIISNRPVIYKMP